MQGVRRQRLSASSSPVTPTPTAPMLPSRGPRLRQQSWPAHSFILASQVLLSRFPWGQHQVDGIELCRTELDPVLIQEGKPFPNLRQ